MFVKRITVGSVWRIRISAPQFRVTRDQSMYPPADRTCVLSAAKRSTVLSQHQSALSSSSSSTTSHIKNNLKKKTSANKCSRRGKNFVTIPIQSVSSRPQCIVVLVQIWHNNTPSTKLCKTGFQFVKLKCLWIHQTPFYTWSMFAENGITNILHRQLIVYNWKSAQCWAYILNNTTDRTTLCVRCWGKT